MATKATIYKALLNIANMDSHYYAEHNLTMAKHPSETDLRLMVRLIAFILNADESLEFTKGISQDDEPDLWKKSLGGDIEFKSYEKTHTIAEDELKMLKEWIKSK